MMRPDDTAAQTNVDHLQGIRETAAEWRQPNTGSRSSVTFDGGTLQRLDADMAWIISEAEALAADLARALAYARALEDRCDYLWHQWHPDTLYGDPIIDDWPEMYGVGDLLDREG